MKNKIEIEIINSDKWEKLCKNIAGFSFFSSVSWLKHTADVFDLENIFLLIYFKEGQVFFPVQKKGSNGFSNFIGYGGFITTMILDHADIINISNAIENKLNLVLSRVKCSPFSNIQFHRGYTLTTSIVDLVYFEGDFTAKKLRKNTRSILKNINKLKVNIKNVSSKDINNVYTLYEGTAKRVGSTYLTPKPLFQKLSCNDNTLFISASTEGVIHAASVFFWDKDTMYYWWNMSDMHGRENFLNYYLIEFAIKVALLKGISKFDMGSSNSESVLSFKKNWNAQPKSFYFFDRNAH